jgi:hypothetical protein
VLLRWLLLPPGPLTNQQSLYFDYTQPQPTAVANFLPQPDSALTLLVRAFALVVRGSNRSRARVLGTGSGFGL